MYTWNQDYENLSIKIPVEDSVTKKDISISYEPQKLTVKIKDKVICDGILMSKIYPKECSYTLDTEKNKKYVVIDLVKIEAKNFDGWWTRLFDRDQEYRVNPERKVTELSLDKQMEFAKFFHDRK